MLAQLIALLLRILMAYQCQLEPLENYAPPPLMWDAPRDVVAYHTRHNAYYIMPRDSLPCYAKEITEDTIVILP